MPESPLRLEGQQQYAGFHYTPTNGGVTHAVYWCGYGPGVVVLPELPGLTPTTLGFADIIAGHGFRGLLTHVFGTALKESNARTWLIYAQLCISREFARLQAGVPAPVTQWLRELATSFSEWNGGGAVAAIGMCLTGGFVIPMLEPSTRLAVTAQPAIPLPFPHMTGAATRRVLNVDAAELAASGERAQLEQLPLVGFRFSSDWKCPRERFDRMRDAFGPSFHEHVCPTPNAHWGLNKGAHSVLAYENPGGDLLDDHPSRHAFRIVLKFLERRRPVR